MKWKIIPRRNKYLEWHRWFAWFPVHIWEDGIEYLMWLNIVERRGDFVRNLYTGGGHMTWEYRMRSAKE